MSETPQSTIAAEISAMNISPNESSTQPITNGSSDVGSAIVDGQDSQMTNGDAPPHRENDSVPATSNPSSDVTSTSKETSSSGQNSPEHISEEDKNTLREWLQRDTEYREKQIERESIEAEKNEIVLKMEGIEDKWNIQQDTITTLREKLEKVSNELSKMIPNSWRTKKEEEREKRILSKYLKIKEELMEQEGTMNIIDQEYATVQDDSERLERKHKQLMASCIEQKRRRDEIMGEMKNFNMLMLAISGSFNEFHTRIAETMKEEKIKKEDAEAEKKQGMGADQTPLKDPLEENLAAGSEPIEPEEDESGEAGQRTAEQQAPSTQGRPSRRNQKEPVYHESEEDEHESGKNKSSRRPKTKSTPKRSATMDGTPSTSAGNPGEGPSTSSRPAASKRGTSSSRNGGEKKIKP